MQYDINAFCAVCNEEIEIRSLNSDGKELTIKTYQNCKCVRDSHKLKNAVVKIMESEKVT
jgi:hypothetical protein